MKRQWFGFGTLTLILLLLLLGCSSKSGDKNTSSSDTDPTAASQEQAVLAVVDSYFTQTAEVQNQAAATQAIQTAFKQALTGTAGFQATIDAQFNMALTATATLWTPTSTFTPSPTFTPTLTFTPTSTPTNTNTPHSDPLLAALDRAWNFSGSNTDWEPFVHEFSNVEMVLVPSGCFMMGSTDEQIDLFFQLCESEVGAGLCERAWFEDQQPVHEVCFEEPFWIDRTEVTNKEYGSVGYYSGDQRPRDSVSWFEARDFCAKRGARLPTEAEWEYAARGPEGWIYPWGNKFVSDYVVYIFAPNNIISTEVVGNRPEGISWVGALDMSGNLKEWVNDLYSFYSSEHQVNPSGPSSGDGYVQKSGSWSSYSSQVHGAFRDNFPPDWVNDEMGFRCAHSSSD